MFARVRSRARERRGDTARRLRTERCNEPGEFRVRRFGPGSGRSSIPWIWPKRLSGCRFIGLSFLMPGVVSLLLSRGWALLAAYGDLLAGVLIATAALAAGFAWAIA